jgi:hypothetical protein
LYPVRHEHQRTGWPLVQCGSTGPPVDGMEEVRGSSPLSSTNYFPWSGPNRIGVISAVCLVLSECGGQFGGSLASCCALKMSSIALAPRLSTGRNSLRYTFSVVRVFAGPTRCAVSSMGSLRSTAARRSCAAALAVSAPPRGAQRARPPGGRHAERWLHREGCQVAS